MQRVNVATSKAIHIFQWHLPQADIKTPRDTLSHAPRSLSQQVCLGSEVVNSYLSISFSSTGAAFLWTLSADTERLGTVNTKAQLPQ